MRIGVIGVMLGLILFAAPLAVLVTAGGISASRARRQVWISALGLVLVSTLVWLVYVGLYQHETPCDGRATRCPTIYGYDAPLPDQHLAGNLLLVAGFVVPAAFAGWRGGVPPLAAGAALALGPTVLAWWTAPRGDNDGLWALVFWFLPLLGFLAAGLVAVAALIAAARRRASSQHRTLVVATAPERLAAIAIDVTTLGAVLLAPLTALSHARLEIVAGVTGIVVATGYLGVPVAWKGRTLGQSLVGLVVVNEGTNQPVPIARALLRSLVVVLEVALVPTLVFAIPAVLELTTLSASGRTLTDRLLRTSVMSDREHATRSHPPDAYT